MTLKGKRIPNGYLFVMSMTGMKINYDKVICLLIGFEERIGQMSLLKPFAAREGVSQ